jgi:hypothetical protein
MTIFHTCICFLSYVWSSILFNLFYCFLSYIWSSLLYCRRRHSPTTICSPLVNILCRRFDIFTLATYPCSVYIKRYKYIIPSYTLTCELFLRGLTLIFATTTGDPDVSSPTICSLSLKLNWNDISLDEIFVTFAHCQEVFFFRWTCCWICFIYEIKL